MPEDKKIIVDEDWKSQVAAEKERSAGVHAHEGPHTPQSDSRADDESSEALAYPPASFALLVTSLVTEAMIAMGQIPDPRTNQPAVDRHQARFSIDMLEILQEKTKGNLEASEEAGLRDVLHQLRMAFVAC